MQMWRRMCQQWRHLDKIVSTFPVTVRIKKTLFTCECSLNRRIYENKMYYENNAGWPKKICHHFFLYALTLANINRFLTLFHCQNQEKICNNTVAKDPTTPQMCRYTTLWNVSVIKTTIEDKTTSVTTYFKKLTTGNNVFIVSVIV